MAEKDVSRCAVCGFPQGLRELDGRPLCAECRADLYLKDQKNWWALAYSDMCREDFFKKFWFENLDEREQVELLQKGFRGMYADLWKPGGYRREAVSLLETYAKEHAGELVEFMERGEN